MRLSAIRMTNQRVLNNSTAFTKKHDGECTDGKCCCKNEAAQTDTVTISKEDYSKIKDAAKTLAAVVATSAKIDEAKEKETASKSEAE